MSRIVTKEEAIRLLQNVPAEQSFWVNNGPILKSLEELANTLPAMNEDTYSHHVNADKNDFSRWINEVVGDKRLANDLLSSRNKESAIKKLNGRLALLKKKAS